MPWTECRICATHSKVLKTYDNQIDIYLLLYLRLLLGIVLNLEWFILVVSGDCHTSYGHSMCKVVILSAVCGIVPSVVYMWRSVANVLTNQPIKLTITWTSRSPKPAWVGSMIRSVGMEAGTPLSVNAGPEIFTFLGSQRGLTFIWKGL